jgi:hypothetical protein
MEPEAAVADTVTIDSVTFDVYGNDAGLAAWAVGKTAKVYAAYNAKDPDAKNRAWVTATRILDRIGWSGSKTSDAQALTWPRDNAYDSVAAASVADGTTPALIEEACYELAVQLALNEKFTDRSQSDRSRNIKRVGAGSAAVEFFASNSRYEGAPLPDEIMDMVARFLGGASSGYTGVTSFGDADGEAVFDEASDGYGLSRGWGY